MADMAGQESGLLHLSRPRREDKCGRRREGTVAMEPVDPRTGDSDPRLPGLEEVSLSCSPFHLSLSSTRDWSPEDAMASLTFTGRQPFLVSLEEEGRRNEL